MYQSIDSIIGNYLVIENTDNASEFIKPISVELCNEVLKPGFKTTLSKHFKIPIEFAGVQVSDERVLCFYLGDDTDLFSHRKFYDCYFKITPSRLFKKYTELSGRDYNFINGKWK